MKIANLIEDGEITVQIEYEVGSSEDKNYSIYGEAFLPNGWDTNGKVTDRDFIVSFSSNWECDTVLRFKGEDYGKEKYTDDKESIAYYQTGDVYGLINISRVLFMIHYLLEKELTKTNTYMCPKDNQYAKSFDILKNCSIEIKDDLNV